MKTLKKSLAMLLALVMSLGCMSLSVWATDEIIDGASIKNAIESAASGDVIDVPAGNYQIAATIDIPAGVTIKGAGSDKTTLTITTTNGDGVKITNPNVTIKNVTIDGSAITSVGYNSLINVEADGVVIEDVIMTGGGRSTWNSSILVETLSADKTFTVKDSTISGSFRGVLRESCDANIVIENCDIDAVYPFNIDGGDSGNGTVTVTGGKLHGWTSYSTVDHVTFTNVAFSKGNSGYDCVAAYVDTTFTNCTFDKEFGAYAQVSPFTWKFLGCEKNGAPLTKDNFTSQFTDSNVWMKCTLIVDDAMYVKTGDESGEWRTIVAQIGNKYYTSLADAIAAAQDGDTVTLLKDVTLSNAATALGETNQYLLAIDKNLTLDGGNNTITLNNATGRGIGIKGANGKIDVLIKNVKIDGKTGNKHYVDTRGNLNSLTLEQVTIDTRQASGNTQPLTIGGNQSDKASVSIKGTTLTAINAGYPISTYNPVTLNIAEKSVLNGYCSLYIHGTSGSAGSAGSEITIDDSTLNVPNPFTYESASSFSAIVFEKENNNTGSTVEITNSTIEISTSNTAYNWLLDDRAKGNTLNLGDGNEVTINGETAMLAYRVGTFNITGGTFNVDPSAYVADGYAAVKMTDDTWKVGPVSSASTEIITTGKDTYTVTTTVKESEKATAAVLSESSASVSVASITKEAITADDTLDTKTTDTVSLANVDTKAVAETVAAQVVAGNVTGANTIEVTVSLSKTADNTTDLITTGETGEVFEVHPVATYVVKDESGNEIANAGGTIDVAKTTVGSFTFKLYLGSGFTSGQLVTVEHYGDGDDQEPTETWNKKVQQDEDGNLYVALTLSSFSHVAVKAAAAGATVDYTVEIADAVSGIQTVHPGDTFTMDVKVKGDDYCGADLTVTYNSENFELTNIAYGKDSANNTILNHIAFNNQTAGKARLELYTSGGATIADGTAPDAVAATLTFKVKDNAANNDYTFDFDNTIPQYQVSYNVTKAAETPASKTGDTVKVVATKHTVSFYNSATETTTAVATRTVYDGSGLPADQVPTSSVLTYDSTIYEFAGWALTGTTDVLTKETIAQTPVTADVSCVAIYTPKAFAVTLPEGMAKVSGIDDDGKAAYGTDVVAKIDPIDSKNFSYAVTYTVAGGAPTTLAINDGKVTVPGDAVRGNIVFTLTKTVNKESFVIAEAENYVTGYTLYLVKQADNNNTSIYRLDNTAGTLVYTFDGKPMFYVKEYNAYAILVQGYKESPKDCVGIETKSNDNFRGDLAIDDNSDTVSKGDVNNSGTVEYSDFLATYYGYIVALEKADGDNMAVYLRANLERGTDENAETADWTASSASYKLNISDLAAVDAVYSGTGA